MYFQLEEIINYEFDLCQFKIFRCICYSNQNLFGFAAKNAHSLLFWFDRSRVFVVLRPFGMANADIWFQHEANFVVFNVSTGSQGIYVFKEFIALHCFVLFSLILHKLKFLQKWFCFHQRNDSSELTPARLILLTVKVKPFHHIDHWSVAGAGKKLVV